MKQMSFSGRKHIGTGRIKVKLRATGGTVIAYYISSRLDTLTQRWFNARSTFILPFLNAVVRH